VPIVLKSANLNVFFMFMSSPATVTIWSILYRVSDQIPELK
jgi:hypothetical protein